MQIEDILLKGIQQKRQKKAPKECVDYEVDGEKLAHLDGFETLRAKLPFESPLLVQKIVIPYFLNDINVIVRAFTGSGKTLSYCLPLVELGMQKSIFGIVIVPSAVLVKQVLMCLDEIKCKDMRIKGVYTHANGIKVLQCKSNRIIDEEILAVHKIIEDEFVHTNAKVLVITPDGLLKMLDNVKISDVTHFVIDEADYLICKDSIEQFGQILKAVDLRRIHVSCFSATINEYVTEVMDMISNVTKIHIWSKRYFDHEFVFGTNRSIKHLALMQLIADGVESPALIFVRDEATGQMLSNMLEKSAVYTECKCQQKESKCKGDIGCTEHCLPDMSIIDDFRMKKIWYLFATDSLSRGVDFCNVRSVINYDIPDTKTQFVHRAGRVNRNCTGQKIYSIYSREDFERMGIVVDFLEENRHKVPEHISKIAGRTVKQLQ
ncbi:ATP-dependent RNA helicase [Ordospora colligata]|uniref:ATP-dependent RNA helicase n=1 Tax=Ordospora colligata OC4 TaxID=1354746 RepID=A0A0B2UK62_9MICR|nr:ATP-dependent RNA helicase [Ordospora colligata OC4]KHN69370.1 ATP-dependent RNA helicase [Ordospora colligata OC4]TBU14884.1 ATP-dependent RNA helicase [Ordospora colligata]TBU15015.1 ATP-dependent RNA helicase [Ordospora colligata]TBU18269.1 ATP-dependent RNA helicase [Ordospora colligata]